MSESEENMYLSKIVLNIEKEKVINAAVDANKMHKLVMRMHSNVENDNARETICVLYEMNTNGRNIVIIEQSTEAPDVKKLMEDNCVISYETKKIDAVADAIKNERIFKVSVITEPYKKVKNKFSHNSRRKVLTDECEKANWFIRKLEQNGCKVIDANICKTSTTICGKKNGRFVYHPSKCEAIIKITDEETFKNALKNGIGSGKSYGMGMLKIYNF